MHTRADLVRHVRGEYRLLGLGKTGLSLIHEVEGLGHIVADAVTFETESCALTKLAQCASARKDAGGLPDLEGLLCKFMQARCGCRLKAGLLKLLLQRFEPFRSLLLQGCLIITGGIASMLTAERASPPCQFCRKRQPCLLNGQNGIEQVLSHDLLVECYGHLVPQFFRYHISQNYQNPAAIP